MSHQAAHDAALVAAAVQAAIREGAPRRTVAAVASAAVGALAFQADRPVQLPTVNEEHTRDAQGMDKDAGDPAVLLTALRAARRAQRLRKKERCREAKLAGLPVRPVPAPGVAVVDDAGDVSMASQAGGLSVASATDPLTSSASWASAAGGLSVAAAADPLASSAEHAPKTVGTKRYRGTVQRYHTPALLSWVHGNGCIAPDDPSSLQRRVQASLATQAEPFVAVRTPQSDVNLQEGFVLGVGVAVTFRVYVDGRGVGACDVSPA